MVFSGDIYSLTVGVVETKLSNNKRQQMQLKKLILPDMDVLENNREWMVYALKVCKLNRLC